MTVADYKTYATWMIVTRFGQWVLLLLCDMWDGECLRHSEIAELLLVPWRAGGWEVSVAVMVAVAVDMA